MPNSQGGKHGREPFLTRLMNTVTSRKSPVVDVLLLFIGLPESTISFGTHWILHHVDQDKTRGF